MIMNTQNLILIGGGGHCKSVIDVAESADFKILGILDKSENVGKTVLGYSIIGTDDDIYKYVEKALFVITVGQIKDPSTRIKISEKVIESGGHFATIISRTAYVSKYAQIGDGTVVMHRAVINAESNIGISCIINTYANIEHDTIVGDFCHVSTGSIINGNCLIGNRTFLGSQATISNGVSITDDCIIAAGAVVSKNIFVKGTYFGNPASLKKANK